jgi:flagellar basal body rod protein FlgF
VASGGTPTLPTASSNTSLYSIKNIDTVNHNIATTSSQTIEGTAGPITITPNQALTLVSDGTNWRIV